jgi:hypothetical protein
VYEDLAKAGGPDDGKADGDALADNQVKNRVEEARQSLAVHYTETASSHTTLLAVTATVAEQVPMRSPG